MVLRKFVIATGVALSLTAGASYGFGLPKIPGAPSLPGAGGGSAISGDAVEQFVQAGQQTSELISNARGILTLALSTKEERALLLSQTEQLKQGLAAKDKKAIEDSKAMQSTLDAQLQAKLSDQAALDRLKSLSAEQRKLVVGSALNLAYGVLMQKDQIAVGQNMITQVTSNPTLVAKLPAIKDTVATMVSNLGGTAKYITEFPKLFGALGVTVKAPTSVDEKPEPVQGGMDMFAAN